MISTELAQQYARQLLTARAASQSLSPLSKTIDLSMTDAYEIAHQIDLIRIAEGETPIGRKLGSTNRAQWSSAAHSTPLQAPTWSTLFNTTVRYLDDSHAIQSLAGALRPKLEPEIVFKLRHAPSPDASVMEVAECVEWMAHGIEIVVSPYPDWQCQLSDAIATFGMHGMLIVSEPHLVSSSSRQHLGGVLASAAVSLSCDTSIAGAGYGSNVMENPLHAIWHLHQLLKSQNHAAPLCAGEIITTGTWMNACSIKAGQTWTSAFSGIALHGLSITFT